MSYKKKECILSLLRIGLGWIFLWGFIDKLFGLGFATKAEDAWLLGGSPTFGFLNFGTKGPFMELYKSLAGNAVVDWLFMLGLLLIGLALILGVGVKIAGYSGALMMLLMYTAGFILPEHNPILDEHIIYALLLILFTFSNSTYYLSLGKWWNKTNLVKKYKFLE